jgi:SRSO17 transposase
VLGHAGRAAHQSLHHFVAKADWSDDAALAAVRACVLPVIERHGAIRALIVDDTGIPKKGTHSVGVARQYCGQLGKQDSCQVAVSLSAANDHASLPASTDSRTGSVSVVYFQRVTRKTNRKLGLITKAHHARHCFGNLCR